MSSTRITVAAVWVFAFAHLLLAPARAADRDGNFWVLGDGNATCEHFLANNAANRVAYAAWLSGWISASKWQLADTYDVVSGANALRLLDYIETFCRQNPTELVAIGALAMVQKAYPSRARMR